MFDSMIGSDPAFNRLAMAVGFIMVVGIGVLVWKLMIATAPDDVRSDPKLKPIAAQEKDLARSPHEMTHNRSHRREATR